MEASSTLSKLRHYLEMNHELNALAALQRGKSCSCQLDSRLGGSGACLKILKKKRISCFDVLLTVHLSIILAINQLNAQNLLL